jgi:peptide/nickel transport system substrate-binding protein
MRNRILSASTMLRRTKMRSCLVPAANLSLIAALLLSALVGCAPAATPSAEPTPTEAAQQATPTSLPAAATPTEAPPEEPVVVAQATEPLTLDPTVYTSVEDNNVGDHIYDCLISRNTDMQIAPGLAESWEISDDGLTWTFHIRKGVTSHDGADFKAEQVKLSLDRTRQAPARQMFFSVIDSIDVVDEYTLEMTTKTVAPTLPIYLSILSQMVPTEYIDEVGEEEFGRHPVGTGPYKLAEWVPGERIVLEANEDYWGGAPEVKTVVFKAIPESSTRIADLMTGAVDLISHVPVQDIERVNASPGVEVVSTLGTSLWFIRFNTEMEPLDDARVRQAMNYAVDVQAIIDSVLGGHAVRLPGLIPSHAFGYTPDVPWPYQYDPEKARELLSEAGYPNGFSAKFDIAGDLTGDKKEAIDVIVAQLSEVGIDVELVVWEPAVYADRRKSHELDALSMDSLSGPTFDADVLYTQFFHSKSYKAYWHPADVEQLIDEAGSIMDEQTRLGLYKQLAEILAREAPLIPMYVAEEIYGKSTRLNWTPRTDGYIHIYEASFNE